MRLFGQALEGLYDADAGNAQSLIADATQAIESLAAVDDALEPVATMLQEAGIQVTEAADALRRYGEALDMDPARRDFE